MGDKKRQKDSPILTWTAPKRSTKPRDSVESFGADSHPTFKRSSDGDFNRLGPRGVKTRKLEANN